jgi:uncharacterized membrane protein
MNKEFRDFLAAEYNKLTAKEQKAADALADEEKSTRQKGAQKAAVTRAQRTFMDMLKTKVNDTNAPEEEIDDTEGTENTDVHDNEPETSDVPDIEPESSDTPESPEQETREE